MKLNFARGMATADSTTDLCSKCKHGQITTGHSSSEQLRFCTQFGDGTFIRFRVADCSRFYPESQPWMREFNDVAWLLRSDAAKKTVGPNASSASA